jgi:hypothetical protein
MVVPYVALYHMMKLIPWALQHTPWWVLYRRMRPDHEMGLIGWFMLGYGARHEPCSGTHALIIQVPYNREGGRISG